MNAQAQLALRLRAGGVTLEADLGLPDAAGGLVVFAHGSGSSRHSPRNRFVAELLRAAGLGTLLMDLLTPTEEAEDEYTRRWRFDVPLLAERLAAATAWLKEDAELTGLRIGYFGASTGAAAAIAAAARRPADVHAVVSRGGRPDLAAEALPRLQAPTLLIVGGHDELVLELNRQTLQQLTCTSQLEIVPEATHLFEEPGTLERVAALAAEWFRRYLGTPTR